MARLLLRYVERAPGRGPVRYLGGYHLRGTQAATEEGDRIGILRDLDQGSTIVWKNDEKLGVMDGGRGAERSALLGCLARSQRHPAHRVRSSAAGAVKSQSSTAGGSDQ